MKLTNQDIINLDSLLGQYSGAMPQQMMSAEDRARRVEILNRVRKYTKFSLGIARNLNIIRPILVTLRDTLKNEKLEVYQKAFDELVKEGLEAKEMEARTAKLKKEHDADALVEENNQRYAELMEEDAVRDDGEPVRFYRIAISQLPGWNDSDDSAENSRGGVVGPLDMSKLLEHGILYEPEETAKKPGPVDVPKPARRKANKKRR